MVGYPRPNRWLVEPDSTARFTQRALVRMKETAKALLSKNKNELSAARTLYVSLDNADNVIEGGLHAIQIRHREIHHNYVRAEFFHCFQSFPAIGRLSDNMPLALTFEKHLDAGSNHSVIIDQ